MNIRRHTHKDTEIAEIISDDIILQHTEDALDLLGNAGYQGFDRIILRQEHIAPGFFDLKSGIAGEILQKFSTYRVRLAITGDFSGYGSKSLQDFIYESNKRKQVYFAGSLGEALEALSQ